jgi:hypothetical protein
MATLHVHEPEPEPAHPEHHGGEGATAVVLYEYEVCLSVFAAMTF